MRVHALLTLALGVLMFSSASAQDTPLECELFGGCPDPGGDTGGDTSTDTGGDTGGDTGTDTDGDTGGDPAEDIDEVPDLALPEPASDQAEQSSQHGLDTANEAREKGRDFGQSRAGKGS